MLDASAVLAFIWQEPGSERVEAALDASVLPTVTLGEVLHRHVATGRDHAGVSAELLALGVAFEPFTQRDAVVQAELQRFDREHRLSIGDRCCLAVAARLRLPVLTADRYWSELELPAIRVVQIR